MASNDLNTEKPECNGASGQSTIEGNSDSLDHDNHDEEETSSPTEMFADHDKHFDAAYLETNTTTTLDVTSENMNVKVSQSTKHFIINTKKRSHSIDLITITEATNCPKYKPFFSKRKLIRLPP